MFFGGWVITLINNDGIDDNTSFKKMPPPAARTERAARNEPVPPRNMGEAFADWF